MANVIAVIWDFDKTLVDGYMQDPIFTEYGVDAGAFWREVNALPERYRKEQGVKVNPDTIYLNQFIRSAKQGVFPGLDNARLRSFGAKLRFYPGVPEIFPLTKAICADDPEYQKYEIKVEHYIVSTGMSEIIKGSAVYGEVDGIWGCELIEEPAGAQGENVISEIAYTIDNTTKTRAIFEINKGANVHPEIDVNAAMPEESRRVPFKNMIYIADGPSDVPAFSVVRGNGGATFAIYPKGDVRAFRQVEALRESGRIDTYAEADYREGSMSYMWISAKIREFADRITREERERIRRSVKGVPQHLNV
ncbi:MAG: haloacid dehalogenase-like hydrolase [Firmicutes bacterium]|nr:haloacid dehalogenase-like hydrolase [Bacillota bacterium]MBQ6663797.1 haloacid dehalogenase-like hydrolase [Bacillota bacterium]